MFPRTVSSRGTCPDNGVFYHARLVGRASTDKPSQVEDFACEKEVKILHVTCEKEVKILRVKKK